MTDGTNAACPHCCKQRDKVSGLVKCIHCGKTAATHNDLMLPPANAARANRVAAEATDAEVDALAVAYRAIASQPMEAWPRMFAWLVARTDYDARSTTTRAERNSHV